MARPCSLQKVTRAGLCGALPTRPSPPPQPASPPFHSRENLGGAGRKPTPGELSPGFSLFEKRFKNPPIQNKMNQN